MVFLHLRTRTYQTKTHIKRCRFFLTSLGMHFWKSCASTVHYICANPKFIIESLWGNYFKSYFARGDSILKEQLKRNTYQLQYFTSCSEELYNNKLWHQLTQKLQELVKLPSMKVISQSLLVDTYMQCPLETYKCGKGVNKTFHTKIYKVSTLIK